MLFDSGVGWVALFATQHYDASVCWVNEKLLTQPTRLGAVISVVSKQPKMNWIIDRLNLVTLKLGATIAQVVITLTKMIKHSPNKAIKFVSAAKKAVRCNCRASIGIAVLRRMLALIIRRITLSLIRPTRAAGYGGD